MIDRPARDKLIARLQWILHGEATLDSLDADPIVTEDESVMTIAEEIRQNQVRLPLSRDDDNRHPSPQGCARIERAILLLRTDMEMTAAPLGLPDRIVPAAVAVFIVGVIVELIAQDRLLPAVATPVRIITLVAGGLFMLRLFVTYLAALCLDAMHIWKVRVLRRTISDLNPNDHWPFASPQEMKRAQSIMRTT